MMSNYFEELEKIANAEDLMDPMVEDPQPKLSKDAVESVQAENSEPKSAAEELHPTSSEELESAVASAKSELNEAKEKLAHLEEKEDEFEKTAGLQESLYAMGAFAKLIHYSTDDQADESLRKIASERLSTALQSEEDYVAVLEKTANEFFDGEENKANVEYLYSREGMEYVAEQLATFAEDEDLEKHAFEMGGIISEAKQVARNYVDGTRDFFKLKDEIASAKAHVDELSNNMIQKTEAIKDARKLGNEGLLTDLTQERQELKNDHLKAVDNYDHKQDLRNKGGQIYAGGAVGLASGGLFAGKKINESVKKDPEQELSDKVASVTINPEENDHYEGGNKQMTIVHDFLKIAGAAGLLELANDETKDESIRKEAAAKFNEISRKSQAEIGDEFAKVAEELYTEEILHEVVAGKHNDYLFDKIAYFTDAYAMSADQLEKVAGADGVAAKGVGGALTDAKSNIEEKVEKDKVKTETVHNGELGVKKADDMRGYNVINNPGEYKVEKTASQIVEEAQMRKEAAFQEYIKMDEFLSRNQA